MPVRIEVGPRDIKQGQYVTVRRDTGDKGTHKWNSAVQDMKKLLDDVHDAMFAKYVRCV